MPTPPLRFFFDYVDPVSFVVETWVHAAEEELGAPVLRHPLEVVTPPDPLLDPDAPAWRERWEAARARYDGPLARPALVPWTRKAHELALHASEAGRFDSVHRALFRAYHVEGRDIGRVDVLADVAAGVDLDPAEARTVLGVDRHLPRLLELREAAERLGVAGVPSLLAEDRHLLAGPSDAGAVRSFLLEATTSD